MAKTIKIDNLEHEITTLLEEYAIDVQQGLEKEARAVGNIAVRQLKGTSPKRTGAYAGDWRCEKQNGGVVVYNRKHYMLTHLLEKSHKIANQFGTYGQWNPPTEHIKPVEENVKKEFIKRIRRIIKGT